MWLFSVMVRTQQTAQTKALKAQHTQQGVTLNKPLQISLISLAQPLLSDTQATSTTILKCLKPHYFFLPRIQVNGAFNTLENGLKKMRFRWTDSLGFFYGWKVDCCKNICGFNNIRIRADMACALLEAISPIKHLISTARVIPNPSNQEVQNIFYKTLLAILAVLSYYPNSKITCQDLLSPFLNLSLHFAPETTQDKLSS